MLRFGLEQAEPSSPFTQGCGTTQYQGKLAVAAHEQEGTRGASSAHLPPQQAGVPSQHSSRSLTVPCQPWQRSCSTWQYMAAMSSEELATKRTALQAALGNRAGRLQAAQYDALIAAQFDTPDALLDATESDLKQVFKTALGAVRAVLAWQEETKQGAGSRITRPAGMTEESLSRASQYTAFIEMADAESRHRYRTAAVVCSSRHIATYQHGAHQQLKLGDQVQVCLPATHEVIHTQVVLVEDQLDCIILAVQGKERLKAPELRPADRGEAYTVLGQSCQKPGGFGTYGHGHIAITRANRRGHILGDTLNGKGDSGAGVFSLDGGYLLGMCVGRDTKYQKTVIVPGPKIQDLLISLNLSDDELSDMELEPNPTYDTD